MREECFYDAMGHTEEPLDDFPNRELWSRMKLDIIDDPTTFNRASPTVIQQHFQSWIESQGFHLPNAKTPNPRLKMAGSASHRFCIIIDAEALQNLLRFPLQPPPLFDLDDHIGVKVLDVECNADSTEYPAPFDAGWLWAAPRDLTLIWFDCPTLAPDVMRDIDIAGRPVIDIEL